jgi:RNA recognition motif-containing protein
MPKVYVGNLGSSLTSPDLLKHFSRAEGAICALAITDRVSGLCRGWGFVEMADIADVAVAFSLLNNCELNGRRIQIEPETVTEKWKSARSRPDRLTTSGNSVIPQDWVTAR